MTSQAGADVRGQTGRHRVVIIGSGFGGLFAAKALKRADVAVTVIARTAHHLFQPLLYQVATGILSEGEVAPALRELLARQRNARVILGDVTGIDLDERTVTSSIVGRETVTPYDSLIVAAGSGQSYFGNDGYARYAPGMKSIDDALELRGRIFGAFELAELATTQAETERLMTFVIVGAGATGVEMAGQIAELANHTLRRDFRRIDPRSARIVMLDAASQVLPAFGERLGGKARRQLEKLGVEVQLQAKVVGIDGTGIDVEDADGTRRRIESITKVWAAGVQASPLGRLVADQAGASVDRAGRVEVNDDLTLPGHPEVFLVGDMVSLKGCPGVAQVAIQGGRYAADQIRRRVEGGGPKGPFHYVDKGSMATISKFSAVASIRGLRFGGFIAWLLWLGIHIVYLIGFKHRVTTLLHWFISFLGFGRSERTATRQQVFARNAIDRLVDQLGENEAFPDLPRVARDREEGAAPLDEPDEAGA